MVARGLRDGVAPPPREVEAQKRRRRVQKEVGLGKNEIAIESRSAFPDPYGRRGRPGESSWEKRGMDFVGALEARRVFRNNSGRKDS